MTTRCDADPVQQESAAASADGSRRPFLTLAAAALMVALPIAGVQFARIGEAPGVLMSASATGDPPVQPPSAPPRVEPVGMLALTPDQARRINATVPFSTAPNPSPRPFRFAGTKDDKVRAVDCLAAAQYYEAGDDPVGQKAVAQVVLNRVRHPAFPKSVCAVVFQGSERATGCQFTFTCDGAMARTPPPAAWDRARTLAARMLAGLVDRPVGYATHYHTDWVVPYWSASLDKITEVHTHLFFRWPGWWGTPRAFAGTASNPEPMVVLMAKLSPYHDSAMADAQAGGLIAPQMNAGAAALAAAQPMLTARQLEGPRLPGGARLIATSQEGDSFIIALPRGMASGDYLSSTRDICSGRTKCRIMGWREDMRPPTSFPIPDKALPSMLFSYIHDAGSGLQRLLWNCAKVPQDDPRNCMRERIPMGQLADAPVNP